jgi:hypothetical protein
MSLEMTSLSPRQGITGCFWSSSIARSSIENYVRESRKGWRYGNNSWLPLTIIKATMSTWAWSRPRRMSGKSKSRSRREILSIVPAMFRNRLRRIANLIFSVTCAERFVFVRLWIIFSPLLSTGFPSLVTSKTDSQLDILIFPRLICSIGISKMKPIAARETNSF